MIPTIENYFFPFGIGEENEEMAKYIKKYAELVREATLKEAADLAEEKTAWGINRTILDLVEASNLQIKSS